MPNIAQQDYIIIDWEGKDEDDAAKKAEVDAQLKNIYLANPLALFSVIFDGIYEILQTVICIGYVKRENTVYMKFMDADDGTSIAYNFSIE